jgi:hypothetical protein
MELLHCNNCSTNINGKLLLRSLQASFTVSYISDQHRKGENGHLSAQLGIFHQSMSQIGGGVPKKAMHCHECCTHLCIDVEAKDSSLSGRGVPGKPLYS